MMVSPAHIGVKEFHLLAREYLILPCQKHAQHVRLFVVVNPFAASYGQAITAFEQKGKYSKAQCLVRHKKVSLSFVRNYVFLNIDTFKNEISYGTRKSSCENARGIPPAM